LTVGRHHADFPCSTFHLPLSTFHFPLSTFHFPPSTFHLPPSTFHLSPSTFHFPLATDNWPLTTDNPHARARRRQDAGGDSASQAGSPQAGAGRQKPGPRLGGAAAAWASGVDDDRRRADRVPGPLLGRPTRRQRLARSSGCCWRGRSRSTWPRSGSCSCRTSSRPTSPGSIRSRVSSGSSRSQARCVWASGCSKFW
jgi:hypothetical protein